MIANREQILKHLFDGDVVALPTDTVYGLATLPTNEGKIKLSKVKGSPIDKNYTLMMSTRQEVMKLFNDLSINKIITAFMPGPLTLIAKAQDMFIGVRVPTNYEMLDIMAQTGPLFVTSANKSGMEPLTKPDEISQLLNVPVLEGELGSNIASTIVKYDDGKIEIIREGAITKEMIEEVLK